MTCGDRVALDVLFDKQLQLFQRRQGSPQGPSVQPDVSLSSTIHLLQ